MSTTYLGRPLSAKRPAERDPLARLAVGVAGLFSMLLLALLWMVVTGRLDLSGQHGRWAEHEGRLANIALETESLRQHWTSQQGRLERLRIAITALDLAASARDEETQRRLTETGASVDQIRTDLGRAGDRLSAIEARLLAMDGKVDLVLANGPVLQKVAADLAATAQQAGRAGAKVDELERELQDMQRVVDELRRGGPPQPAPSSTPPSGGGGGATPPAPAASSAGRRSRPSDAVGLRLLPLPELPAGASGNPSAGRQALMETGHIRPAAPLLAPSAKANGAAAR